MKLDGTELWPTVKNVAIFLLLLLLGANLLHYLGTQPWMPDGLSHLMKAV